MAQLAADGWGGDRLLSLDGPDGSWPSCGRRHGTVQRMPTSSVRRRSTLAGLDGARAVLPGANIAGEVDAPVLVLLASNGDALQQVEEALGVAQ